MLGAEGLTSRELLALRLLTQGRDAAEIAASLEISTTAARGVVARVLHKLAQAARTEQARAHARELALAAQDGAGRGRYH